MKTSKQNSLESEINLLQKKINKEKQLAKEKEKTVDMKLKTIEILTNCLTEQCIDKYTALNQDEPLFRNLFSSKARLMIGNKIIEIIETL